MLILFSAMLHLARYGSLPKINHAELLRQADFWLNSSLVLTALQSHEDMSSVHRKEIMELKNKIKIMKQSKVDFDRVLQKRLVEESIRKVQEVNPMDVPINMLSEVNPMDVRYFYA